MQSRLEKVKYCFQQMDLEGLKSLLIDSDILFQTNRKTFFSMIEKTFKKAKEYGDTYFRMLDNIEGFPEIDGNPAVRFFGIPSLFYFEFFIYATKEDKVIIQSFVEKNSEAKWPTLGYHYTFHIDEDEKLPEFQDKQIISDYNDGAQAIKELNELQKEINDLSRYIDWIDKYNPLFERNLDYDQGGVTKFYDFFGTFLGIRKLKYFNFEMYKFVAKCGYLDFLKLDTSKMEEVVPWLCRYERLPVWLISYYDKSVETNAEKGYFEYEDCKIRLNDLDEVLKFIHYFTFYNRYYSEEFYRMGFEYEFTLIDYHHFDYKGFYEVILEKTGIPAKPIKIKNEEDPIEKYFTLQAIYG